MIRIKRVYDPHEPGDGLRFLVDRLWPRGMKKENLPLDGWLKEVAPSDALRRRFGHENARWEEFCRCYNAELEENSDSWSSLLNMAREQDITLLYSANDIEHNNAVALRLFLNKRLAGIAQSLDFQRDIMIRDHLGARGIRDQAVLKAMREVPREAFVEERFLEKAYGDYPLPIGEGQTISQPYIVAYMTQTLELKAADRLLEIGTGSGYAAAVLSRIATTVYTVEHLGRLALEAEQRLERLGYSNIIIHEGDGTLGWPEHAPYDAIVVTAGAPDMPQPLLEQLAIGGRLVIPVGRSREAQELIRVRRISEHDYRSEELCDVRFVPLIGAAGW